VSRAGQPLEEFARQVLRACLERVLVEAHRAGDDPAEDPVHDVRVAIRRWGQALRVFADILPRGTARKLRKSARALLDAAGATRDYDIGADLLRKEGLRADHPLFAAWEAERSRACLAVKAHVLLHESAQDGLKWRTVIDGAMLPRESAGDFSRRLLPSLAAEFFEAGRRAVQRANEPERLHAFRLAAKRFRYTLEIFAPCYGPTLQKRIEQVREIQGILGKRQDAAVSAERIQPAVPLDLDLAQVHRRLESRGAKLEQEFLRFWRHTFDAAGELERWQRYLCRRPPARRTAPAADA
jgi:CHAD domain-containing protein